MDLCVRYGQDTLGIELKVWRPKKADPAIDGLYQLDEYLAGLDLDHGWLFVFDRRPDIPPIEERLSTSAAVSASGRKITVIRA